jgi:hypothetical protein
MVMVFRDNFTIDAVADNLFNNRLREVFMLHDSFENFCSLLFNKFLVYKI